MLQVQKSTPRSAKRGVRSSFGSVAVGLAAAGPDQNEGLGVFIVEEVGVDWSVKARIVELDREIVAALGGALRPGGPDLGAADIDPVAWGIVADPICLRDDADAPGLEAQGHDFALEFLSGFLECADVSHVTSPCCCRARDHPGLDADL